MNKTYYEEKLETLPENLQYAVMMSDWKKSLVAMQSKFKLHIDQTQVLEDNVIRLMFGDIDAPDFINHMFNDGHINSELAADILLEVDLKILKNIRERLEKMEQAEQSEEIVENLFVDDDEREARETSEAYSKFYEEAARIRQETEDQMAAEGILSDGSNITDEMLGITQEIPEDIAKEKNDLLNEIDTPTKSFKPEPIQEVEYSPIPADHQIENIHLEKPYQEEVIVPPAKAEAPTESKPEVKLAGTEIKKPININLNDIYREPIE